MESVDFEYIQNLVYKNSANVLEAGKEYLAEVRLTPIARREGFPTLHEWITHLRGQPMGGLHVKLIEAMTTNETMFFRDVHPFEALKTQVFPELIARRQAERAIKIWCAASSTGQEPYSIAMLLDAFEPQLSGWNVQIIATDLAKSILQRAQEGVYSQFEISRGLPKEMLEKYFQPKGSEWQIIEKIRNKVTFREINLAGVWPVFPPLDIVFIRNVMIYFDMETKKTILNKIERILKPDGYLFLGGAETTINLVDCYERQQLNKAGCYRIKNSGNSSAARINVA